jgi:hypothetical protein
MTDQNFERGESATADSHCFDGVGLYSLWQTDAKPSTGDISYTQQSSQALKEQAGEFVSAATDIADHAQEVVSAKVSEALDPTNGKIPGWADNVGGALGSASASVKSGSQAIRDAVRRTQHDGVSDSRNDGDELLEVVAARGGLSAIAC